MALLVLLASSWLALVPPTSGAQDHAPLPGEHEEVDVHEQMNQLIQGIERTLRGIDEQLWGPAAPEPEVKTGPLLARLELARDGARKAIDDIDHLLRIAEHPHEGGGGT